MSFDIIFLLLLAFHRIFWLMVSYIIKYYSRNEIKTLIYISYLKQQDSSKQIKLYLETTLYELTRNIKIYSISGQNRSQSATEMTPL